MGGMDFSVVIPTYKRPDALATTVRSLLANTLLPKELLIIDDDTLPTELLTQLEQEVRRVGVDWRYYQKDHSTQPRGSSASRNLGIELAKCDIVCIFDDDLVLEVSCLAAFAEQWKLHASEESLFAVGAIITNNRVPSRLIQIYHRCFGLGDLQSWDVNAVGFQSWNNGITEAMTGHYAHGGVCSYHKSRLATLGGFATFQGGRTALEDVEFFLRAKLAGYHTIVTPAARVRHEHSPLGRENKYQSGYKEGYNRVCIYQQYAPAGLRHWLWFVWANKGWTLRKFLSLQFAQGWGMMVGSVVSIVNKTL